MPVATHACFQGCIYQYLAIVEIDTLFWFCLRDAHGELEDSRVGFAHAHIAGRYKRIEAFMHPEFFDAVVIEFFAFIVNGDKPELVTVFLPELYQPVPRRQFIGLFLHEINNGLFGKGSVFVKKGSIEVLVKCYLPYFIYIKNELVQDIHFFVGEPKFLCGGSSCIMTPSIAQEHAANVQEYDFFKRHSHP